jgi:NADH-quinone oxidoreductase subunit N
MAALTMTVGNVLAVLQTSVKRTLAYSSVAHSGYMLVGLVAGPGKLVPDESGFLSATFTGSGLSALLFYLLSYGVMNLGAFAVLASLERTGRDGQPEEIDSFADLRGLCRSSPVLGYTMVLSALGLLGLPPTLGFFAKLPLFTSAISSGQAVLVVILGINSAIAAFYYLKLAGTPWLESADTADGQSPPNAHPDGLTPPRLAPFPARTIAGVASAVGVVVLAVVPFTGAANHAAVYRDSTFDPSERAPGLTKPVRSAGAETTPTPNAPANP